MAELSFEDKMRMQMGLPPVEDAIKAYRKKNGKKDQKKPSESKNVKKNTDGGEGSGNFEHEGRPGEVGGSAPSSESLNESIKEAYKSGNMSNARKAVRKAITDIPVGSKFTIKGTVYTKIDDDKFEYAFWKDKTTTSTALGIVNGTLLGVEDLSPDNVPVFEVANSSDVAEQKVENGELDPKDTSLVQSSITIKNSGEGQVASDSEGNFFVKGSNGKWTDSATGESLTDEQMQERNAVPMTYEGPLKFDVGVDATQEGMDSLMSELNRNMLKKDGTASIDSDELYQIVSDMGYYGTSEYCQMILSTQDPDMYPEFSSGNGLSDEERKEYAQKADNVEKYIEYSDPFEGTIYRGISLSEAIDSDSVNEVLSTLEVGNTIDMGHIASWSSAKGVARSYAENALNLEIEDDTCYAIIYSVKNNKTAVKSKFAPEEECLTPKSASYKIKRVNKSYDEYDNLYTYNVDLEEV